MPEDQKALMKKVIVECKEQSIELPEVPKNLFDPEVIASGPGNMEIHLAKRDSQIMAVITENRTITKIILLDDSALVGIIGWTTSVWERLLQRLPIFRNIIDSEAKKNNGTRPEQDILLDKDFLEVESEEDLMSGLLPTEEEIQEARRTEYERSALLQINWDTSAQKLKRAADNLFRIYIEAMSKAETHRGPRILVEGGKGWEEHLDEQLIDIYYMLMGLSIENLFKGIIIINHPEYLTPEGLEKISKHETYEFIIDPKLKDLLKEFQKYIDILVELTEYVKWKGKYPVSKIYKESELIDEPIDRDLLIELYNALYRRAWRERRLKIIRKHEKIEITFKQFMDMRKEIDAFRTPSTKIKDIKEAYSQWSEAIILHVLEDIAEDLEDKSLSTDLRMKIELYKHGHDV